MGGEEGLCILVGGVLGGDDESGGRGGRLRNTLSIVLRFYRGQCYGSHFVGVPVKDVKMYHKHQYNNRYFEGM